MNSIKSSVLLLLSSVFVVIVLSACSNDDLPVNPSSDPSNTPNAVSSVRVLESGYVSTKLNVKATSPDNLVEFQREDFVITPLTEEEVKTRALQTGEAGEDGSVFGIYNWATLLYRCTTADGTERELSELVVWPFSLIGHATPSQLVIGCHSTITSDAERPTNFSNLTSFGEINMLALFTSVLSQKALVIVPDYEGFGSTATYPHPYLNRELTAEQVVKGAQAGLNWFESEVSHMDEGWAGHAEALYRHGSALHARCSRYDAEGCHRH